MSSRNWIVTKNNPDILTCEEYLKSWKTICPKCTFVTGQLEKGEQGTVHLQFFLNFSDKVRLAHLQKHDKGPHYQVVKINNGADEYCNKEETRVPGEGPWTFGIRPPRLNKKGDKAAQNQKLIEMGAEEAVNQGLVSINQYLQLKKNIDAYKIATAHPHVPEDVRGIWIWGPPGIGKSRYAREHFTDIYLKSQNKWWDGYTNQQTVLLEDHDSPCLGHYLKIWMDRYACNGESKGSTTPLQHRVFVVTSNYEIDALYEKDGPEMIAAIKRRCKVIHMTDPFNCRGLGGARPHGVSASQGSGSETL